MRSVIKFVVLIKPPTVTSLVSRTFFVRRFSRASDHLDRTPLTDARSLLEYKIGSTPCQMPIIVKSDNQQLVYPSLFHQLPINPPWFKSVAAWNPASKVDIVTIMNFTRVVHTWLLGRLTAYRLRPLCSIIDTAFFNINIGRSIAHPLS